MTTKGRDYPTRVNCQFEGKSGQIVLDQIRTVDKSRLVRKLGKISNDAQDEVLAVLWEMFSEQEVKYSRGEQMKGPSINEPEDAENSHC